MSRNFKKQLVTMAGAICLVLVFAQLIIAACDKKCKEVRIDCLMDNAAADCQMDKCYEWKGNNIKSCWTCGTNSLGQGYCKTPTQDVQCETQQEAGPAGTKSFRR